MTMTHRNFVKHSTLIATTVSLFGLGGLAMTSPSHAAIIDLGDLTTWETFGDVISNSQTASMSTNALSNDDFGIGPDSAFNFSGNPAGLVGVVGGLEDFLGLPIGGLDPDPGNFEFAFEGSAIKQTFTVQAGDELFFRWNFLTNELLRPIGPLQDYAFVTIDDQVIRLVDNVNEASNPSSPYGNETGINTFSQAFLNSGTFTVGLGVVDVDDFDVSSALIINPIPEPSSTLGLLFLGILSAGSALKHKKKNHD